MSKALGSLGRALVVAAMAMATVHAPAEEAIGRLKYGGGGDWYANPTSLPNLLAFARERTSLDLPAREQTVEPDSPELSDYAYVHVTGHGRIRFTDDERRNLRTWMLGGGFLHVDDNYGMNESFREEVARIFPGKSLVELPFAHPIYHCFYQFKRGLPKIHEHDGGPPRGYGIVHEGRVILFYSFNTDLGDGWEGEQVHHDPAEKREAALQMGTNLLVYALSR